MDLSTTTEWTLKNGLDYLNILLHDNYGVATDTEKQVVRSIPEAIENGRSGRRCTERSGKWFSKVVGDFLQTKFPEKRKGVGNLVDFPFYNGVNRLNFLLMQNNGEREEVVENKPTVDKVANLPPPMNKGPIPNLESEQEDNNEEYKVVDG